MQRAVYAEVLVWRCDWKAKEEFTCDVLSQQPVPILAEDRMILHGFVRLQATERP